MTDDPPSPDENPEPLPEPAVAPRGFAAILRSQALDTRPLRHPAYRRMLIGQGTAFIGSMLTQVAVPVQIYAISHSSLYVGLVGLAGFVPIVVFGLYGGAIADAVDRRRLYFWSSIGSWLMTLALLAQTIANVRSIGLILVLVAVQSGTFAIASSARGAITPRLVDRDEIAAANTMSFTIGNFGSGGRAAHRRRAGQPAARVRLRVQHRRASCSPRRCTRPCGCRRSRRPASTQSPGCGRCSRGWRSSPPGPS